MLRNVFDQYEQPENRLTHALFTVLDQERSLLIPFLRWLGIPDIPKAKSLKLTEQRVPGISRDAIEIFGSSGLPDAAIFDDEHWAVLFESKIQSCLNLDQVKRHRRSAQRHGYDAPWIVLITVEKTTCILPPKSIAITWQQVYAWFNRQTKGSNWRNQLVHYMQVFEQKMLLQEYQIKGTITVFDGLRFGADNPYTYREAKRLIRLLGDQLQHRKDLRKIVNPNGDRRPAISGKDSDQVWDFLPLIDSFGSSQFTSHPHLDIVIGRSIATAAVTIPNGVKGRFRGS